MDNRILIVHASCGKGHENAARALSEEFGCDCYDILDFTPWLFQLFYRRGYRFIVRYCHWLWVILFEVSKCQCTKSITRLFNKAIFYRFIRYVRKTKPQIVLSTHFFSSSLISLIKHQINCKNMVLVTDLGVHPLWLDPGVDRYYVGLECTRKELLHKKVDPAKIMVTGLPLRNPFYRGSQDKDMYEIFSLTRDRPSILFLSTDLRRMGYLPGVLKRLNNDFHLVVSYGSNLKLKEKLEKLNLSHLTLFAFSDCIWTLIQGAHIIVTKPGGLTVFESFQLRKPLVFTHFIWGQEKSNMEVIEARGVGFYARSACELIDKIYFIHNNLDSIEQKMFSVQNARTLIREDIEQLLS